MKMTICAQPETVIAAVPPAQPRRRRQRHRSALPLTNRERGADPSGGNGLTGDKIEHDRRRAVVAKRVRYLPDSRSNRSPAAPVVQRAVNTVREEPSGKDDAPRVHRILGFEALRQSQ